MKKKIVWKRKMAKCFKSGETEGKMRNREKLQDEKKE
jgi:hypothetical protein